MSNAAKLKKKAVELEQKKQFDKALALYKQFLEESDGALDDADVPLYNRVGDLLLRIGNTSDALNYYEKAVDLYAERGFLNNAIALCNKVLRQSPGRASIYYKLGKISATKGFKSDAKKNFLEYADRMQKGGQINEAFRALKEFADLCPDQDDIRLLLAEQLSKENRQDEALEQLQKLHDKLESEGRSAEARATVDRMKAIDPNVVPRTSGSYPQQKSSDLVFLDISYDDGANARRQTPRQSPGHHATDPDLVVLTLTDPGVQGASPDLTISGGVEPVSPLDLDAPDDESEGDLVLLDVGAEAPGAHDTLAVDPLVAPADTLDLSFDVPGDSPAVEGGELVAAEERSSPADALDLALLGGDVPSESLGTGAQAGAGSASELADDFNASLDTAPGDLFDFRTPPRVDDLADSGPQPGLDPDVSFPALDFGDPLPSADEVTSGGFMAISESPAAEGLEPADRTAFDLPPGPAFDSTGSVAADSVQFQTDPGALLEQGMGDTSESTPAARSDLDDLDLTWDDATPAPQAAGSGEPAVTEMAAATAGDSELAFDALAPVEPEEASGGRPASGAAPALADAAVELAPSNEITVEAPAQAPQYAAAIEEADEPRAPTPDAGVEATVDVVAHAEPTAPASVDESPAPELLSRVEELRARAARAPDDLELRRQYAEALLEDGDRAGGTRELEAVMVELERRGQLESAHSVVDELIRLAPNSVRHHQKRVELAVRASDRAGLIDAYIDLGDALFRSGEEEKARFVYQRVLELAPEDARARAALLSIGVQVAPPPPRPAPAERARPAAPAALGDRRTTSNGEPPSDAPTRSRSGGGKAEAPARASQAASDFVNLGDWLREDDAPRSTRMVTEEKAPTGDEQADFQEMLKKFKQGVAENVDEEDYDSHYDLGVAFKEMGLIDEAVAEFQKALRGSNHRIRAYEALGQCFVEKEQFQVASTVLGRALASANGESDDHQLVGVLYLLGRASEALNKDREALDYYQRVFAVEIEFRDVTERMRMIERKAT